MPMVLIPKYLMDRGLIKFKKQYTVSVATVFGVLEQVRKASIPVERKDCGFESNEIDRNFRDIFLEGVWVIVEESELQTFSG